jgi:hypothetical protein
VEVGLQDGNHISISFDATVLLSEGEITNANIIAILIGLFRPAGFMDYTDDACLVDGMETTEPQQIRACEMVARAWNRYLRQQYRGLPRQVVIIQDADSIRIWGDPY